MSRGAVSRMSLTRAYLSHLETFVLGLLFGVEGLVLFVCLFVCFETGSHVAQASLNSLSS